MKAKLIVLLLVVLSLSVMLASCGAKGCEQGVHTLDEGIVTTAPTCVDEGVRTHTCTLCGATVTKVIAPIDEVDIHHFNIGEVTTAPTCLNDGVRTLTCILCGKTETKAEPATGDHTFGSYEVTKAPTCGKVGEKVKTCSACGFESKAEVAATGLHLFDEGTVIETATCSLAGMKIRQCQNEGCDATHSAIIPATGLHVAGTEYVATDAVHYTPCQTCGMPMNEQAHNFNFEEGEVITPVEGCKSGVLRATCIECNKTVDTELKSDVPHNSQCIVDKENNVLKYACADCGEGYSYTIAKIHDLEDEGAAPMNFKDSSGAEYNDKSKIKNVILEEGGNKYQAVYVSEDLSANTQVQNVGTLPITSKEFVFAFDIRSASATNDATFGVQFFNSGTSDWSGGRGQQFFTIKGSSIETSMSNKVTDISTDTWTKVRMEITVSDAEIYVRYFVNNEFVFDETRSNSMYKKTVVSFYMSGSWKNAESGFHFDNIIIANK